MPAGPDARPSPSAAEARHTRRMRLGDMIHLALRMAADGIFTPVQCMTAIDKADEALNSNRWRCA